MIHQSELRLQELSPVVGSSEQSNSWQDQLQDSFSNASDLYRFLKLQPEDIELSVEASRQFSVLVPLAFAKLMKKGDINDPLLRQVLNLADEDIVTPSYQQQPLEEEQFIPVAGLIHKYHGRVLLIVAGKCAINCRYCFRRNFAYADNTPSKKQRQDIINYIKNDASISEVILSGGDPLAAPTKHLQQLTQQLEQIEHVQRLRIHTRLPVVIPDRIDTELLQWLQHINLPIQVVLHINHANELSDALAKAIKSMRVIGVHVMNQSVLLKGINDNVADLALLQTKGFEFGILPYYLFLLDKVQGAAHFAVSEYAAKKLILELQSLLPGYLVPKLAVEIPGEKNKRLIHLD